MATNVELKEAAFAVIDLARQAKKLESNRVEVAAWIAVLNPTFTTAAIDASNPGLLENGVFPGTENTPEEISNAAGTLSFDTGNYAAAWTAGKTNLEKLCRPKSS